MDRELLQISGGSKVMAGAIARSNASHSGHILLPSGRHGDRYFDKERLLAETGAARHVAAALDEVVLNATATAGVDCYVGAHYGGSILAYSASEHYFDAKGTIETVSRIPVINHDGKYVIRESLCSLVEDKRVWIFQDVIRSGQKTAEVVKYLRCLGCQVLGITTMVSYEAKLTPILAELDVPVIASLYTLSETGCDPGAPCKGCQNNEPLDARFQNEKSYRFVEYQLGSIDFDTS